MNIIDSIFLRKYAHRLTILSIWRTEVSEVSWLAECKARIAAGHEVVSCKRSLLWLYLRAYIFIHWRRRVVLRYFLNYLPESHILSNSATRAMAYLHKAILNAEGNGDPLTIEVGVASRFEDDEPSWIIIRRPLKDIWKERRKKLPRRGSGIGGRAMMYCQSNSLKLRRKGEKSAICWRNWLKLKRETNIWRLRSVCWVFCFDGHTLINHGSVLQMVTSPKKFTGSSIYLPCMKKLAAWVSCSMHQGYQFTYFPGDFVDFSQNDVGFVKAPVWNDVAIRIEHILLLS